MLSLSFSRSYRLPIKQIPAPGLIPQRIEATVVSTDNFFFCSIKFCSSSYFTIVVGKVYPIFVRPRNFLRPRKFILRRIIAHLVFPVYLDNIITEMASPWAIIKTDNETSFEEIEAEEIVKSQQEREFQRYAKTQPQEEIVEECEECALDGTDSDAVIAQLLQNQYNKEHDLMLKRTEDKFNGASKVNISYSNYRAGSTIEPEERAANVDEDKDLDRFVSVEKEYADIKRRGYKKIGEGSEIVTKHDMLMSSRINACRVLEFPPGIKTGDTGGFDAKLNNKVFNSLRAHSHAHCARQKATDRQKFRK